MQLRFYLGINKELDTETKLNDNSSFIDRTKQVLAMRYQVLEKLVSQASNNLSDSKILPIVICGEDFFKGGEISTHSEEIKQIGKCMDRDTVFEFFAKELTKLSSKYPSVLLIPGSVYVSVDADSKDNHTYTQDTARGKKATIYAQNIVPIFYKGEWIRLLKKGDYLEVKESNKSSHQMIKTEYDFKSCLSKSLKANVPEYHEDTLTDINNGLIFFGETPLPGEKALLNTFNISTDAFYNPVFSIENELQCGIEICGDHGKEKLQKFMHDAKIQNLNLHIVTSNGIGKIYDATQGNGYRVQADAESKHLTGVETSLLPEDKNITVIPQQIELNQSIIMLHQSPTLPSKPQILKDKIDKYQQAYKQMIQQIELAEISNAPVTSGFFHGQSSRPIRDLKDVIKRIQNKTNPSKADFEEINQIASRMGKGNQIAVNARRCLNWHSELAHLGFNLELHPILSTESKLRS